MKSRTLVTSLLAVLLIPWAVQLMAQSTPNVGNSGNPPAFQKFAAPVSSRLAFLASEKGKQVLLASPNPLAKELLMKYHGAEAAALWDKIPHKYATPSFPSPSTEISPELKSTPLPQKGSPAASGDSKTRCAATQFNLEGAAGAMPQNTVTIDFKFGGGSTSGADFVGEGSNDWRGLFLPPAEFSSGLSGYYFQTTTGCLPQFEGALPPIPDPWSPANRMWGVGSPILNYAPNQDAWFYSSVFESESDSGVGVFRNTTANLGNSLTCPAGTHNLAAAIACWPLGPARAGYGAVIVAEEPSASNSIDSPYSWVDSRTGGTGAGDVYITDTLLSESTGTSSIYLTACNNALSACSVPEVISGPFDTSAQFSDVKTWANGNITITYGNYNTERTPSQYAHITEVDIKYVVCTPQGAPNGPGCSAPVLVASEWQPVSLLASLADVRNNTHPVHIERAGLYPFVFWERCGSYSDLPFGGLLTLGGVTCPDADIVGAYSIDGGTTWSAPFAVDNGYGHQIMPWAVYDSSTDDIAIAYQDCDSAAKAACRAGYRTILSGTVTVGAFNPVSAYAYPETDANWPWFEPLFGDYIGASARGNHLWIGFSDTTRTGTYGYGTEKAQDSNNNVAAVDNWGSSAAP